MNCELVIHLIIRNDVGDYKVGIPVFKGTRNHERECPP